MSEGGEEAPVLFDVVDDHIALIRLNRPAARNAVDGALARAMVGIVQRIEDDPTLRVAVLGSTSPGFFSAGADLKVVAAGRVEELRPGPNGFAGLIDADRRTPWIAAVGGFALGGGCEMALACDMIVATANARFGLPEVKRGLIANAGGVHRIGRVLPRNVAMEMVATGNPIDGETAHRFGMVNRLVDGDVLEGALALARTIAANAPLSVAASLAITRQVGDRSDADLRRLSRAEMTRVMRSDDAKEGPRAFIEKRKPDWTGR